MVCRFVSVSYFKIEVRIVLGFIFSSYRQMEGVRIEERDRFVVGCWCDFIVNFGFIQKFFVDIVEIFIVDDGYEIYKSQLLIVIRIGKVYFRMFLSFLKIKKNVYIYLFC